MRYHFSPDPVLSDETKKRRKQTFFLLLAVLLLSAVLIVALLFSVFLRKDSPSPTIPASDPVITYHGHIIPVVTDIPVNPYDPNLFISEDGFLHYTEENVQTFRGIDVSSHQGEIDWEAVKAAGVDFAMIRVGYRGATEGEIYLDNQYVANINRAVAAGIDVGIYFFSQALTVEEAEDEANVLLQWIKGYRIAYPIVFDWEFMPHVEDNRSDKMTKDQLTKNALAFCSVIQQAGYSPMIYFDLNMAYNHYDLSLVGHIDFWLAEWHYTAPSFYYEFHMLQYTSAGTVPGISGEVDLNLCFVDYANLSDT